MPTVETICNNALDLIGYKRHIGNIFEGTPAARIALDVWAQTRDSLLYSMEPDWACKDVVLVLLRSAPSIVGPFANYDVIPWDTTYPPLPWLYEYSMPDDSIKPLSIKRKDLVVPNFRPRSILFQHRVGASTQTILTNSPDAILTYIFQSLNLNLWDQSFTDSMVLTLAKKFEPELTAHPQQPSKENANAS